MTRFALFGLLAFFLSVVAVHEPVYVTGVLPSIALSAQEVVTLTTPQTQTATSCTVTYVGLDLGSSRIVVEVVLQPTGARSTKVYDGTTTPTGATLLHQLNIGNFSVNSLLKAVYNRLSTDGVCVGTVGGTPQH